MNINEAKTRFTALTGLQAKAGIVYREASRHRYIQRGLAYIADNSKHWNTKANRTEFWVLLVEYLNDYCEIGGDK